MTNRRNKSNKTKAQAKSKPNANTSGNQVTDDELELYRYVLDLATEKYDFENHREQDLVQQSGQMQAAFSFMTAALFMALPIVIDHRGQIPESFFFVVSSIICFFLMVSLVLASIATWRWKKVALGNITAVKQAVLNSKNREYYLKEKNRISAQIDALEKFQVRKEELNNRRAFLIHLSLIFFFFAIGSVVISFTASIIMYML